MTNRSSFELEKQQQQYACYLESLRKRLRIKKELCENMAAGCKAAIFLYLVMAAQASFFVFAST